MKDTQILEKLCYISPSADIIHLGVCNTFCASLNTSDFNDPENYEWQN